MQSMCEKWDRGYSESESWTKVILSSISAIETARMGIRCQLPGWFRLGDSDLRSAAMVQGVNMKICGLSKSELNNWNCKGRTWNKQNGPHWHARTTVPQYAYKMEAVLILAQAMLTWKPTIYLEVIPVLTSYCMGAHSSNTPNPCPEHSHLDECFGHHQFKMFQWSLHQFPNSKYVILILFLVL